MTTRHRSRNQDLITLGRVTAISKEYFDTEEAINELVKSCMAKKHYEKPEKLAHFGTDVANHLFDKVLPLLTRAQQSLIISGSYEPAADGKHTFFPFYNDLYHSVLSYDQKTAIDARWTQASNLSRADLNPKSLAGIWQGNYPGESPTAIQLVATAIVDAVRATATSEGRQEAHDRLSSILQVYSDQFDGGDSDGDDEEQQELAATGEIISKTFREIYIAATGLSV